MCAAMDPAVSLSTHSLLPMVPFVDHVDHAAPSASKVVDEARPRTATSRRWEDAAVEARAERSMRVHWFGCGVRLSSP